MLTEIVWFGSETRNKLLRTRERALWFYTRCEISLTPEQLLVFQERFPSMQFISLDLHVVKTEYYSLNSRFIFKHKYLIEYYAYQCK